MLSINLFNIHIITVINNLQCDFNINIIIIYL